MAGALASVLVVEDEVSQREIIAYNLRAEGFEVVTAETGDAALLAVREAPPDIILLDWMLPGVSGIEIARRLKQRAETRAIPIIMLSARGEEADKVRGLESGADDYVSKPYSIAELVARVKSHLRRARPAAVGERFEAAGIMLDTETYRVTRDGREVKLGPLEFRLLATLIAKPGRVWTRERLLDEVWGRDIYVDSRTVDVHVARLRKSLSVHGGGDPIRTVRGVGYALD
jgi:two-component system phosphate regulon response regulator PhoB